MCTSPTDFRYLYTYSIQSYNTFTIPNTEETYRLSVTLCGIVSLCRLLIKLFVNTWLRIYDSHKNWSWRHQTILLISTPTSLPILQLYPAIKHIHRGVSAAKIFVRQDLVA